MKYYIATKLDNVRNHNIVRNVLEKLGHQITYDWTIHGSVFDKGIDEIMRVQDLEVKGVKDADVVIVLPNCPINNIPTGRGTHVELGLAIAWEKDIHIVGNKEIINGSHKETTCFWLNPLVTHSDNEYDLIVKIRHKYNKW